MMWLLGELMDGIHRVWMEVWRLRSLGYKRVVIFGLATLTSLPIVVLMYRFTLHQADTGKMLAGNAYLACGPVGIWLLAWHTEMQVVKHERELRRVMAEQHMR